MSSKKSSSSDATSDGSDLSQRIFAIDVLRSAAGDKVFERGVGYHEEGLVEIFSLGAARVRARVIGTEPYMVDLAINNGALDGRCTCPAHRDFGFCKHMVAAGLAANDAAVQGELSTGDGLDPIRKHLDTLTPDMLRRLILDFAESDPGILRKLSLTAALVTGDEKAIARKLKREITAATKIRGYVEYDEAPDWAANVGDVLLQVGEAAGQGFAVGPRQGGGEWCAGLGRSAAAVQLQCSQRGHNDRGRRPQAGRAAFDVKELLRAQVAAEARFRDDKVGQAEREGVGHD